MAATVAINGFGRIGRSFLRSVMQSPAAREKLRVVAINTGPTRPEHLDILFKFDSVMRQYHGNVSLSDSALTIDGHEIKILSEANPEKLPWKQLGVDWVIESSGCFTHAEKARQHCSGGAKKVFITAPASNEDITIIPGINDTAYNAQKHHVIAMGSCTTNCFAPLIKVLHETYGIVNGLMTTVHAYTNDQVLLDVEHKDPRRARAAAINIVPTKTGADKVITKIFPELEGKLRAIALRVPVADVSLIDFNFVTAAPLTCEGINQTFKKYADGNLKGVLEYCTLPLVSSDFIGNEASCVLDSLLTQATGSMGKVCAWYDNEFGYSCRLRDFLLHNS
jgi:glyceraldehyde 3-phosphate dehydrogenase